MKKDIMNNVSRTFHKVGFKFKKHSPEILVVSGIVGTVTASVMACKATMKAGDIVKDAKENMHNLHLVGMAAGINEMPEDISTEDEILVETMKKDSAISDYTEHDLKKDTSILYAQTAGKFIKLYGPSILLGAVSITAILAGHNITRKRNIALAAAYATVDKGFKAYRSRVIERFGEELDKELKYNIKAKTVEEVVTDEEGNETVEKNTVEVADLDPTKHSEFARFFDEFCTGWTRDAEANKSFLMMQQTFANEKLKRKGYLYLNDVYEMLGIPKTKAGHVVGWIYDSEKGDGYVDFGIFDLHKQGCRDFVNGYEKSILLDFNVDGNIWNKMDDIY